MASAPLNDGDGPELSRLAGRLLEGWRELPERWRQAPLGVCLSAGGDSSALALAASLARSRETDFFPHVHLLHVCHGLRGEASRGDAQAARELAARLGLPCELLEARVEPGPGLEARARAARYLALRQGFPGLLATAHHRGDQAETVLLRLLRGAGPMGLRGIAPLREDGIWRPFLGEPRARLRSALNEAGWTPREDGSNADTAFSRNLLRHKVLPELETREAGWEEALSDLARSAEALRPHLNARMETIARATDFRLTSKGFGMRLPGWPEADADPELDLFLEQAWTRTGRRPWSRAHRSRLVRDVAAGAVGQRRGGQGETAFFGGGSLRIEAAGGRAGPQDGS
jgi:tRNA(Ile)-lysidine synthase